MTFSPRSSFPLPESGDHFPFSIFYFIFILFYFVFASIGDDPGNKLPQRGRFASFASAAMSHPRNVSRTVL